jgi:hypothetical protein
VYYLAFKCQPGRSVHQTFNPSRSGDYLIELREAGTNAAVSNATDTDTGSSSVEFEQWLLTDWLKSQKKGRSAKRTCITYTEECQVEFWGQSSVGSPSVSFVSVSCSCP